MWAKTGDVQVLELVQMVEGAHGPRCCSVGGTKELGWDPELEESLLISQDVRLTEEVIFLHQWVPRFRVTGADPEHLKPAGSSRH